MRAGTVLQCTLDTGREVEVRDSSLKIADRRYGKSNIKKTKIQLISNRFTVQVNAPRDSFTVQGRYWERGER
jgi:hypothetical protein